MKRWLHVALIVVIFAVGFGLRLRIGRDWAFAGSDSYGYLRLADELHRNGRYALGPPPEPLYWGRPPVYPIFLAAVIAEEKPNWFLEKSYNFERIKRAQLAVELLLLAPLVYLLARRFGGRWAAVGALALALLWPITAVYFAAVLTELLAMLLSTAAIALLVLAERPRLRFFAVGLIIGVGALLRFDTLLLGAGVPVALYLGLRGWRERTIGAGLVVAGVVLGLLPWAVRNQIRFGAPHVLTGHVDKDSHPIQVGGYRDWLATWAHTDGELRGYAFCYFNPDCNRSVFAYPAEAFDTPEEVKRVGELLAARKKDGFTSEIDNGFREIAQEHRQRHWWRTGVALPFERAKNLWFSAHDDILLAPSWRPWPKLTNKLLPYFRKLSIGFALAMMAALAFLLFRPRTRMLAAVVVVCAVVRTAALALLYYPEGRYVVELMPVGCVVIAVAVAEAVRRGRVSAA
jgi:4-amino-4-deoxy-L-arabinose transferase-like glycosyltransferase